MNRRLLLLALFLLAFAGLILHYRIHPFFIADKVDPSIVTFKAINFIAFLFSLFDLLVVTILFLSRGTAVYGYLFNGIIVIYGTVLMAHFSIAGIIAKPLPIFEMILRSTLPHIMISWADFFVGKVLYDLYIKG
ncbi:MAG: hypothetical protein N2511_01630 [Thermodesulfovibrionales bacterium]|nr:hypothetical protein [Thermodesulfovibrionales bacterium]